MAWVLPSPASYVLGPGTPDFRLPVHLPSTLCSHHLPQEMLEPGAKICQPRVQQVLRAQYATATVIFEISQPDVTSFLVTVEAPGISGHK